MVLPKKNRIKKKKLFEEIFKKGRGIKGDLFFAKILKNELDITRVGVVISSKISKKAVRRNLLRRRVSEVIRLILKEFGIKGWDIIFIARPGADNAKFKDLRNDIEYLFQKAKIIKKRNV